MSEKKNIKEKMALCGSYVLSGAAAASAALAVAAPFVLPPEAAKDAAAGLLLAASTFSAAAQKNGGTFKPTKIKNLQNKYTKILLCGFALQTSTSEVVEDMQRLEEAGQPQPTAVAVERPVVVDRLDRFLPSAQNNYEILAENLLKIAAGTSAKELLLQANKPAFSKVAADKKYSRS